MAAPASKAKAGSRWGNLLSGAVAGIESRLDTILAEDDQASAKSRAAESAAKPEVPENTATERRLQVEQGQPRNSSRSRPSSRLQDRLAKAVNKANDRPRSNSGASSDVPSGAPSPAPGSSVTFVETARASLDSKQSEAALAEEEGQEDAGAEESSGGSQFVAADVMSPIDPLPSLATPDISTPQPASNRQSIDSARSRQSLELSPSAGVGFDSVGIKHPAALESELASLQASHQETLQEHREELNSHLERIDALQSKLGFLSEQLASEARIVVASEDVDPIEKKVAEKDAQIAALMLEGQNLAKTELKHSTQIKKLRETARKTDKRIATLKKHLATAERGMDEAADRARRAEYAERAAQERLKVVGRIEKDLHVIQAEREEASLTITELRRQLSEALTKVEEVERRVQADALEAERKATAELRDDIQNLRIEKQLVEERGKKGIQEAKDEAARQQERAKVSERELQSEIANLETKLELLRSRSEEATSSATGDSQTKLLRQVETLQTQYALASENWQGIETALTSRVAALEKERDEAARRESDVRRKARELNIKVSRLEGELEGTNDRASGLEHELGEQRSHNHKLQARLAQAETAAQDARAELEREKKLWEEDLHQRLEEEKTKARLEVQNPVPLAPESTSSNLLRAESPSASNRKASPDFLGLVTRKGLTRALSTDVPFSPVDRMMLDDRRPSGSRKSTQAPRNSDTGTPVRQESFPSSFPPPNGNAGSQTPSIFQTPSISQTPSITLEHDENYENTSSPRRTINDMISISTVGAGPSVQLVERMSAAVRRLESEKAASKEEMARLVAQRDEAREEVVALMREAEEKRAADDRVDHLELELKAVDERYQTTLEMLGEKSERVDELTIDVADLKKIYRDLVERTMN